MEQQNIFRGNNTHIKYAPIDGRGSYLKKYKQKIHSQCSIRKLKIDGRDQYMCSFIIEEQLSERVKIQIRVR